MTGRELVIYILQNKLEDTELFGEDLTPLFTCPEVMAVKWGCGISTVKTLVDLNKISGLKIGDKYYILANEMNPFERGTNKS